MRNVLLIALLLMLLQSCDSPNNEGSSVVKKPNYTHFDLFVKRFIKNHPKMGDNDIQKQEANDEFKKQAIKFFNDSAGLADLPLRISSINKLGKGYVIHLQNDPHFNANDISEDSHIDIFALASKSIAQDLKQSDQDKYLIKSYRKVNYLRQSQLQFVTTDMLWSDHVDIRKKREISDIGNNTYGNYILEAKEIKHL